VRRLTVLPSGRLSDRASLLTQPRPYSPRHSQVITLLITLGTVVGTLGCSNLDVRKVPNDDRACGVDDQEGFRYYLNRPYLVVKAPILVSEARELVLLKDVPTGAAVLPRGEVTNSERAGGEAPADAGSESQAASEQVSTNAAAAVKELQGKMQIVYLPDLDEQYVIKSKNCLAKSTIALQFANGTELVQVDGDHDATTVTIALLDQIQNAIEVAGGVIEKQAEVSSKSVESGDSVDTDRSNSAEENTLMCRKITRVSLKPGMYRLQKPWESNGGMPVSNGSGYLAQLGVPTVTTELYEIYVRLDRYTEFLQDVADREGLDIADFLGT